MGAQLSKQIWTAFLAIYVTLLLMLAWSFLYIEPGTATYVVAQMSAVMLIVSISVVLLLIYVDWNPF